MKKLALTIFFSTACCFTTTFSMLKKFDCIVDQIQKKQRPSISSILEALQEKKERTNGLETLNDQLEIIQTHLEVRYKKAIEEQIYRQEELASNPATGGLFFNEKNIVAEFMRPVNMARDRYKKIEAALVLCYLAKLQIKK